jgi:hypothetical protein
MTRTDPHAESSGAPSEGRPRTRSVSLRTVLASAVAVATVAGAAVLGVHTLAVNDQSDATERSPMAEQDDSRATQSSLPDPGPAASVFGRAWEDERFDKCVEAQTHGRPMASSDDGLPNPWAAGSIAAKCYLERVSSLSAQPIVVADAYHGVGFMVCPRDTQPVTVADSYHGVGIAACT